MNPLATAASAPVQLPPPAPAVPVDLDSEKGEDWEAVYDAVPPRKSVAVSARFRFRGRGEPLPYPVDEASE